MINIFIMLLLHFLYTFFCVPNYNINLNFLIKANLLIFYSIPNKR